MSKIEQIIGEIEEYIDSCRFQPLSNTKIIVNKDEIDDFLDDLRQNIPDEVRKYQRIIANRDAILRDAQDKADEMIRKANEMTSTLVSEHEIMQQAFKEANVVINDATAQAQMILENATAEANEMKMSAIQYTDDSLGNIQNILNTAIEGLTVKYDGVMRSLESSLDVTTKDRQALREFTVKAQNAMSEDQAAAQAGYMPEGSEPQEPAVDQYMENAFDPSAPVPETEYGNMTLEQALDQTDAQASAQEEAPDVSDYGSADEIKDFDLAFDDFK